MGILFAIVEHHRIDSILGADDNINQPQGGPNNNPKSTRVVPLIGSKIYFEHNFGVGLPGQFSPKKRSTSAGFPAQVRSGKLKQPAVRDRCSQDVVDC